MKLTKKIISVILAVVMIFGTASVAFASPIQNYNNIDNLIEQSSIANLAEYLLNNINVRKSKITGTVLRFVFLFVKQDSLQAIIGDRDVTKLSDAELATILIKWLDGILAESTASITEQSWVNILNKFEDSLKLKIDFSSTKDALNSVYLVTESPLLNLIGGDIEGLKGKGGALKGIKGKSDLDVIYSIFQFIVDNMNLIKKVICGKLDLGAVDTFASGTSDNINSKINDILSKEKIRGLLYKLIDGKAEEGEYEASVYYKNGYTADQLLAAGLIRLIKNTDPKTDIIAKDECNKALGLDFYALIAKYGPELLRNIKVKDLTLIESLNNVFGDLINNLMAQNIPQEIKDRFEFKPFKNEDFDAIFGKMTTDGVLNQFNDIICLVAKHVLSDAAYASLKLDETNGNRKLNSNMTKIFRYTLPALAQIGNIGGFDFSSFTSDKVKKMTLSQMGAAVLKLFFPTWFSDNYSNEAKAAVNDAKTIDQLAVIATKLALTNEKWIKFALKAPEDVRFDRIRTYDNEKCKDTILSMGAEAGALALSYNSKTTHFTLPENRTGWNYERYLNEITNWAVNFIKGIPAVVEKDSFFSSGKSFYKINVILNEVIDFSFLNAGYGSFTNLDIEKLLFNNLLGNLFNLDFEGILDTFKKNNKPSNLFNQKVINGVLKLLDKALTALFEHNCQKATVTGVVEDLGHCKTRKNSYEYCTSCGHYVDNGVQYGITETNHSFVYDYPAGVTCKKYEFCEKCGEEKKDGRVAYKPDSQHPFEVVETIPATTTTNKIEIRVCKDCGLERRVEIPGTMIPEEVKAVTVTESATIKSLANGMVLADVNIQKNALLGASNANSLLDSKGNDTALLATGVRLAIKDSTGKIVAEKTVVVLGDIDGNGSVNVNDARGILRAAVKLDTLTSVELSASDIDFVGGVTVNDARGILRVAVKLDNSADLFKKYK